MTHRVHAHDAGVVVVAHVVEGPTRGQPDVDIAKHHVAEGIELVQQLMRVEGSITHQRAEYSSKAIVRVADESVPKLFL